MNKTPPAEPSTTKGTRWPIELVLVIGLPLMAVMFGSAAAITAFAKGFTVIPEVSAAAPASR